MTWPCRLIINNSLITTFFIERRIFQPWSQSFTQLYRMEMHGGSSGDVTVWFNKYIWKSGGHKEMSSILTSALKCGGMGMLRGLSQWVQLWTWSQNKLWRSNNLCWQYKLHLYFWHVDPLHAQLQGICLRKRVQGFLATNVYYHCHSQDATNRLVKPRHGWASLHILFPFLDGFNYSPMSSTSWPC